MAVSRAVLGTVLLLVAFSIASLKNVAPILSGMSGSSTGEAQVVRSRRRFLPRAASVRLQMLRDGALNRSESTTTESQITATPSTASPLAVPRSEDECAKRTARRPTKGHVRVWSEKPLHKWRVMCWVLTYDRAHFKLPAILATWGRRCDGFLACSNKDDLDLRAVNVGVTETGKADVLIEKSFACWNYLYDRYRGDYDAFLKADDDTYVVMENLRRYLDEHGDPAALVSSQTSIFAGKRYNNSKALDLFNAGGPSYVLNRPALDRAVCEMRAAEDLQRGERKHDDFFTCPGEGNAELWKQRPTKPRVHPQLRKPCAKKSGNHEDVMMGRCLGKWDVLPNVAQGSGRADYFLALGVGSQLRGREMKGLTSAWFDQYNQPWGVPAGAASVSKWAIGFHYVKSDQGMWELECELYEGTHDHGVKS